MRLNEKNLLNLLNEKREIALQNCLDCLSQYGNDPERAIYNLNDQDEFLNIYKNILSDDEINRAFEDVFGEYPFTSKIGDLEMDIWIEAAQKLNFDAVEKELERVKKEGI